MRFIYLLAAAALASASACEDPNKTQVTTSEATTSEVEIKPLAAVDKIILDFATGSKDIQFLSGPSAAERIVGGQLQLRAFDGVMSSLAIVANVGELYQLEYEVRAAADPVNGLENIFFLGPIGLNAKGEIVQWWKTQASIKVDEGIRKGFAYLKIAPGTAEVRIGVNGNWADPPPAANGTIAFIRLRLEKVPDAALAPSANSAPN